MLNLISTESRPEAMADVPGVCEVPLTRAVVQYRDIHELDYLGGRIQDIGMAVVVEGRFASSSRVIDLGSADVKYLDLSSELVVLDWVYDPTLAHIRYLANAVEEDAASREELAKYCFALASRILGRTGFTPLTRSTLLRIGFRDVCKDLDLHEGTTIRISTGGGRLTRVSLDYDACALRFGTGSRGGDATLANALAETFPDLVRVPASPGARQHGYEVRFGVPLDFAEARRTLGRMRRGLNHLIARFEPERFKAINGVLRALGTRETLDHLNIGWSGGSQGVGTTGGSASGLPIH